VSLNNPDRFGFYTVGDFKTYSKLEAIEHRSVGHKPVEWHFNRQQYEVIDWTQEPPGSLEFWYAERARQIREKYDYIVLWYSGGADSHNALMSFVKNNIFIDEIAQFHNLQSVNEDKKSWLNEEVFATSAPNTQQLIETNPVYRNTKHRMVDLSDIQTNLLINKDNKWDYFYQVGKFLSPNTLARSYLRETITDYQILFDQGKSVCFIHGHEKPHVKSSANQWYFVFRDSLDNAVTPRTQMRNCPWEHDELFYWSDSLPQLIVKQAHVIKRYMSQLTPDMADNIHVYTPCTIGPLHNSSLPMLNEHGKAVPTFFCGQSIVNNIEYRLLPHGLHRLIYPDWVPESIVCGKPASLAYSNRDLWMFNSSAPNIGQHYYNNGLVHLRQLVKQTNPDYWWEHKFNRSSGIPYMGGFKELTQQYQI